MNLQKALVFHDKVMNITLSDKALAQSEALNQPLIVEVQIYFSCLLAKRLAFYSAKPLASVCQVDDALFDTIKKQSQHLHGNVYVRYNTIMTQSCPASGESSAPPVTDFEVANQKPYVPSWLNIFFDKDTWSGEYGWKSSVAGYDNTKQVRAVIAPG